MSSRSLRSIHVENGRPQLVGIQIEDKSAWQVIKTVTHRPPLLCFQYEYLVLLDLLKKGHQDPATKMGSGIKAFQIREHPEFTSRCFYLVRTDGSTDDFSYRKCVDKLMTLPADMQIPSNKGGRGRGNGGSGGGGRGYMGGRGGGRRGSYRGGRGRGRGR